MMILYVLAVVLAVVVLSYVIYRSFMHGEDYGDKPGSDDHHYTFKL